MEVRQVSGQAGLEGKKERMAVSGFHAVRSTKHQLYDGIERFDADYDTAVAWNRLTNGIPEERDIVLLNHEYLEHEIEKEV